MVFERARACFCFNKKDKRALAGDLEADVKQVEDAVRQEAARHGLSKQEQETEQKLRAEAEKRGVETAKLAEEKLRAEAQKVDGDQGVKLEEKLDTLAQKEGIHTSLLPPGHP